MGGATSAASNATLTVTGVNGASAPVLTRRLVPSTVAVHGSPSPATQSARSGSAGSVATTEVCAIGICHPEPTTSHHHHVSPSSPGSNTSLVDDTMRYVWGPGSR